MLEVIDRRLFFVAFILISNEISNGEAIVGGEDAENEGYNYTVSIQDIDRKRICTGGIIGKYHVVTAAHCVATHGGKFFGRSLLVVVGTSNLFIFSPKRREIHVEKVFIPCRYSKDTSAIPSGDIAVLKLNEEVGLGRNYRLKLPANDENFDGSIGVVTGFGWNEVSPFLNIELNKYWEEGRFFGKMRFAQVRIYTREMCSSYQEHPLTWSIMCAQITQRYPDSVEGVCTGDSGGPLVVGNVLVGVVNISPPGCDEHIIPSLYARVSSYVNFIKKAKRGRRSPHICSLVLPPLNSTI